MVGSHATGSCCVAVPFSKDAQDRRLDNNIAGEGNSEARQAGVKAFSQGIRYGCSLATQRKCP